MDKQIQENHLVESEREKTSKLDVDKLREELFNVYQELSIMYEIGSKVNISMGVEDATNAILKEGMDVIDTTIGIALLEDEKKKFPVELVVRGANEGVVEAYQRNYHYGLLKQVAQEKKIKMLEELGEEYPESFFRIKNILIAPLITKDKSIGAIAFGGKKDKAHFTELDKKIIYAISAISSNILENIILYEELGGLFFDTVWSVVAAAESKDPYSAGHSRQVTNYAICIAKELGMDPEEIRKIKLAGLLHDIGKIKIKEEILTKPGRLTEKEYAVIKQHPEIGVNIIKKVSMLEDIFHGVREHHERWDGKGYPYGLKGEEISLIGRILAVADAFDAMTSNRAFRPKFSESHSIQELKKNSGTQFDPRIVDAFVRAYKRGFIQKAKDQKAEFDIH
jgi:putative nucleotidyltransferase with HDIG domain